MQARSRRGGPLQPLLIIESHGLHIQVALMKSETLEAVDEEREGGRGREAFENGEHGEHHSVT